MIFDTHTHYDDPAYDSDRNDLLESFKANNVIGAICASAEYGSIPKIIELCNKYSFLHPTIGIHPSEVEELDEEKWNRLEEYIKEIKPVAIGEIGLDYHYDEPSKEIQRSTFLKQLAWCDKYDLSVIIHSRDASEETFEIMKQYGPKKKGVIHCYSGSAEMAVEYVKMGYYIGVGGVVTFKNGRKLKETVQAIGLENILLETDCPYLAPTPHRGERNSSLFLPYVVEEIASLKNVSKEEVEDVTIKNAEKLFGIKIG